MMPEQRCLSDGELRDLIERPGAPHAHLVRCPGCRARLERIRADAGAAAAILASPAPAEIDPTQAYHRWRQRQATDTTPTMKGDLMHRFTRVQRAGLAGAVLAAVMALALIANPVTTLADSFLNQFRIQHFTAITVPMDLVQGLGAQAQAMTPADKAAISGELQKLGSFSTTFNMQGATKVGSLAEAQQQFSGLDVPKSLGAFQGDAASPSAIYLGQAGSASYTVNVAEADKLLQSMNLGTQGLPDPQATPTVTFKVDVNPSAVMVWQQNGQHLIVGQTESPVLNVPDSVNMDQLRDDLMQFPLIPADIKAQLNSVTDWKNTLIVPVPQGATHSDVTIGNSQGLLVQSDKLSFVLWQDHGVLHVVASDSGANVVDIAKSLKPAA